ncbi:MAG: response regulator [Bryobacteraceae bacterium]
MARVLLIDDDADQLDLRKLILEHHGHTILSAATPAVAESLFREDPPDAVVMDLRLPEAADGLRLIRQFRGSPAFRGRLFVPSGFPTDLAGTAEEALVDAVLAKPFRSENLVALLSTVDAR